jgi:hypothetical protein
LNTREKSISFSGSVSTTVPKGMVQITDEKGVVLYSKNVDTETYVSRCPQSTDQKSSCVFQTSLEAAPMSMVFAHDMLWYTMLSEKKSLHSLDVSKSIQTNHIELGGTSRLFSQNNDLFILREHDGLVRKYDPESQKLISIHSFASSWSTGFAQFGTTILTASWLKNIVFEKKSSKDVTHSINKPKKIIPGTNEVWILQSEPAAVRSLSGKKSWVDPNASYSQGFLEEEKNRMWVLDIENNKVQVIGLKNGKREDFFSLEEGNLTDLGISSKWVVVSVHLPGTGLSLGRGELMVFSKKSGRLIDKIQTVASPNKLILSEEGLLVIGDISTKSLNVYDLSLLPEDVDE